VSCGRRTSGSASSSDSSARTPTSASKKKPTRAAAAPPAEPPAKAEAVQVPPAPATATAQTETPAPKGPVLAGGEASISTELPPGSEEPAGIGIYRPGRGFRLSDSELGEVNFGIYTYLRFLEQKGLDSEYTNGFGKTVHLDKREDVQLNKVKLEFRGWLIDPRFQYVLYTWTNQAAQGLGAQVVVGGNLNWRFSEALLLGGGILSLADHAIHLGELPVLAHRRSPDARGRVLPRLVRPGLLRLWEEGRRRVLRDARQQSEHARHRRRTDGRRFHDVLGSDLVDADDGGVRPALGIRRL
jgi:hypothetical protein